MTWSNSDANSEKPNMDVICWRSRRRGSRPDCWPVEADVAIRSAPAKFYGSSESDAKMKRALDVLACALFLAVFWPVLLLIIVAIRLQSPGKAIFAQARVGKNGRPFTCYKLRTMYSGTANLPTHQVEASAVTPFGELLRRFKIDELPQLWNVLAGDMSLVGPRPCLPSQVELADARRRLGVFEVRPGITGLAQVSGVDMSDAHRLAEIDARYVRTQSLIGDIRLIWATLSGQGVGVDQVIRSSTT
ncbi:MAG: sugar transferase [Bradyrhizobium sp.]